jgi:hypothetical protein
MQDLVLGGKANPWNLGWRTWGLRLAVLIDFSGERYFVNAPPRIAALPVTNPGRTPRRLHTRSISTFAPGSMNPQDF